MTSASRTITLAAQATTSAAQRRLHLAHGAGPGSRWPTGASSAGAAETGFRRTRPRGFSFFAISLLLLLLCVPLPSQSEPKQITVYSAQTVYSLPVTDREGKEYVGLAELLEPLGSISAKLDGNKWKLRFSDREAQFQLGRTRAKVHKRELDIGAPFIAENGRGFVPLQALPAILPELLPARALNFHQQARRLFLDRAQLRYAAELRNKQLVLTFTAPVNPFVATEQGKLKMTFRREPLLPGAASETHHFGDPAIMSLTYGENNGTAELTVNGNAPLIASFSSNRKTITISAAAPPQQAQAPAPPAPQPPAAAAQPPETPLPPPAARFTVMIDPAHGGDDPGAKLSDKLNEKDVTLAFARRLRKELEGLGIAAHLLRDSDLAFGSDQRAVATNAALPALYIAVHAAASGSGVHLFTSTLAPLKKSAVFLPWDSAQAGHVGRSQQVASAITTELLKSDITALALSASLRPLDSIAAPALAVEVAPPVEGKVDDLTGPRYQEAVCKAIATAIAELKPGFPQPRGSATPSPEAGH